MQQQLISLSPDLKRLQDEGYELEVRGGHILVHHVPYLNSKIEVKYGVLVSVLTLTSPNRTGQPNDHTIYFCGEPPCDTDGKILNSIINNSNNQQLSESITVNHYFSSRPISGNYENYYDKFRTYAEILSSQAWSVDKSITTKPNQNDGNKQI